MTTEVLPATVLEVSASGNATIQVGQAHIKALASLLGESVQLSLVAEPVAPSEQPQKEQGNFAPEPPGELLQSLAERSGSEENGTNVEDLGEPVIAPSIVTQVFKLAEDAGYAGAKLSGLLIDLFGTVIPINRLTTTQKDELLREIANRPRPIGSGTVREPHAKLTAEQASRLHAKLGAIGFPAETHKRMASDKFRRPIESFTDLTKAESITLVDFAERQIQRERA